MRLNLILLTLASCLYGQEYLADARSCVEHTSSISHKQEIYALIDQLIAEQEILETGSDDLRVKYVHAQGCIEHVLACSLASGKIDQLVGVIHTPMPATPLCVKPEGPFPDISDPDKLLTVTSRAQIVREYLKEGGKLYIAYPQGGLEKRTPSQQQIYREELANFPNLIDYPLPIPAIEPDMIGATYLFRNKEGRLFAFSIKSRQVNDMQSEAEWGLWFGPLDDPKVAERVTSVFEYLTSVSPPALD